MTTLDYILPIGLLIGANVYSVYTTGKVMQNTRNFTNTMRESYNELIKGFREMFALQQTFLTALQLLEKDMRELKDKVDKEVLDELLNEVCRLMEESNRHHSALKKLLMVKGRK